jgi:hypothetical protein
MKKIIVSALLGIFLVSGTLNAQTDAQKATKIDSILQVYTQKKNVQWICVGCEKRKNTFE